MAWTEPTDTTTGQVLTSGFWNTQVADNLRETAPALASIVGQFFIATGTNDIVARQYGYLMGDGTYTGSGTVDDTYIVLSSSAWGTGTSVQFGKTTGTTALVIFGCARTTGNVTLSYDLFAGATTISASDTWAAIGSGNESLARLHIQTGITAGTNNFRLVAKSSDISAATITRPYLFMLPLN